MVLEFIYAEGCHTCHETRPTVVNWAAKHRDSVTLFEYDGGTIPAFFPKEAPQRQGMFLTPTIVFKDGVKVVSVTVGKVTDSQLTALYKKALSNA